MDEERQGQAPEVPETAEQGAETQGHEVPDLSWVEASIPASARTSLDGAHGIGAGERRQRRGLVQSDR